MGWRQLSGSTSPIHRIGGLFAGITTIPKAEGNFHGGLRELVACLICRERAHDCSINGPDQLRRRPVDCVGVESSLGRCNGDIFGNTVIQNTFAEVVGLSLSSVGASELPINLVQVIGEQDHAADYAFPWSNLGNIFDTPEKEEEVRIDGRSITLFPKVEHGTHLRIEGGVFVESAGPVAWKRVLLREIHKVRAGRETQSIRASNYKVH